MELPKGMTFQRAGTDCDGELVFGLKFADGRNVKPFVRIYEALRDMPYMEQVPAIAADTERALKRAKRRAEELAGEWERVEFQPDQGPTVEFTGRMLAERDFEPKSRDPIRVILQVWETKGGALVAVEEKAPTDGEGRSRLAVGVFRPTGDAQDQRFAVLDFFGWTSRARDIARKLGWSVRTEVE